MQSGQRHVVYRLGRFFAWGVGAVALLLGVAFAYAQTPIAKEQISRVLSERLSEPPNRTEISGLRGLLPFDVQIGRISVADTEGEWLRVNEARLELAPADLVTGRLRARELGAGRVTLERLPKGTGTPSAGSAMPALPELPEAFPPVSVDRMYVNEIDIGTAVVGEAARFRLDGSLVTDPGGQKLSADLAIRRTDKDTTAASLHAALDLAARTLTLESRARDDGSLVGALFGRPETGPVSFELAGSGPLDDFSATLHLAAENLARLDAKLAFSRSDVLQLAFDGRFRAAEGVLPAAYAGLVGESTTVAFELKQTAPSRITMPRLQVRSGLLELEGQGTVALDSNRIDGSLTARIPDLARASAVVGHDLGGSLTLTARPRPRGPDPAVELAITGRGLRYDGFEATAVDGRVTLEPLGPLERDFTGVAAAGDVDLSGVAAHGRQPPGLQDFALRFAGRWQRSGGIDIADLVLAAPTLDLQGNGKIDTVAGSGRLRITAKVDAARHLLALALPDNPGLARFSGGLAAEVGLTLADAFRKVDGTVVVTGKDLAGLPAGSDGLVGPAPRLQAGLSLRPGSVLRIRDLDLEGAHLRLTGTVGLSGPDRKLDGSLQLAVPDLAPLSAVAGRKLAGGGEARVALAGSLADPTADLELRVAPLAVDGYRLDRFDLDLAARQLRAAPAGKIRAEAGIGDQKLALTGRFLLQGRHLQLRSVTLEGPKTKGTLELGLDLDRRLASGTLELAIADLAALSSWHRQKLAGGVDLVLKLDQRAGRQDAELAATARDIRSAWGALGELRANARVEDLFGEAVTRGELRLAALRRSDLTLESGELGFSGPLSGMTITADLSGATAEPFEVTAAARLALGKTRQELTLTRLDGTVGGQKVGLRNPAHAVLQEGVLKIDRLDLFVGKGRIRGELENGHGHQLAHLTGNGLPLAVLARLAGMRLQGKLDFALDVGTAAGRPRARLQARVADLRPEDLLGTGHAPVDLELSARLENGMLQGELTSASPGSVQGRLRLRLPVSATELPPKLALAPDAPLAGDIDAKAELALVTAILGLRDQYVTGRAEARLRLSGTVSAPRLNGDLQIRRGHIEDGISGAVLQQVVADFRAEGDRLRIARFEARDPRGGRVEMTGELRFPKLEAVAYRLGLKARRLEFWNTALATVTGRADLTLAGGRNGAELAGAVVVERGEIRVLARSAIDIPEIQVVEVGDKRSAVVPVVRTRPASERPFPLRFDVRVDIPGRLFARGGGLDSEWAGRLRIAGGLPAPSVVGTIEAKRATLDLLGRRFRLRQGHIIFSGAAPPRPRIELIADAQGPDITALFHLSGPLSKPALLIESEPPLPRDEVIAHLLFGADTGRLEPMQALQMATILAGLEGGGLDIVAKLRKLTALDTLRISSSRSGTSGADKEQPNAGSSYVTAGKYLTDDVYVEVEQSVRGDQTAVRAEVDIGAGIKVGSVVDETGGGVELEWQYDF